MKHIVAALIIATGLVLAGTQVDIDTIVKIDGTKVETCL
tara:strand:+ start:267 stop:383 length:117 start_codon:yes stop_codon:yes gene_type:complete